MGVTVQWRGENDREPGRYGKTVTFGNIRDKGTGYMSYSDRVGPGLVVLGASTDLCDRLTEEGFTALAPVLGGDDEKNDRLVDAAIDHLVDNWHPRIGVVGVGEARATAQRASDRRSLDGWALLETEDELDEEVVDDFRYDLS